MSGTHHIQQTIFAEGRDPDQLPTGQFLKHIRELTRLPGVEIIQGTIEFHPESEYWRLCIQGVLPFEIGGGLYQNYDVIKVREAYDRIRASLGLNKISCL